MNDLFKQNKINAEKVSVSIQSSPKNSGYTELKKNQSQFDSKVYEQNLKQNQERKQNCPNFSLNTNPITAEGHVEKAFKPSVKRLDNEVKKLSEQKEWKPSIIRTQLSNKQSMNEDVQKETRKSTNALYGHYNTTTTEQKQWKPSIQKAKFSDQTTINKEPQEKLQRNKTNAEFGHYNQQTTTQKEWKPSIKKADSKQNECHIFDEVKTSEQQQPRVNQNNTTTVQKEWKPSVIKVEAKQSQEYEVFNKRGVKKGEFSQTSTSAQNPLIGYDKDEPKIISKKANNNLISTVFSSQNQSEQPIAKGTHANAQKNKGDEAKNLLNYEYSLPFNKQPINKLNQTYPGGLKEYTERAKRLLKDACDNVNPYEGFKPEVPVGEQINFSSYEEVQQHEAVGREELRKTGFVLVAGGLGERLGYQGIKIGIPFELTTRQTFLEYYLDFIKTYGNQSELAIMTSDDTHTLTVELLEKNNYFGFPQERLTIMKQEKVPAMLDNDARFAQVPGSLLIETKPHGHGDVHTLLHQHGLTQKWLNQGKQWVVFFQDTNPLVFRSLPSVLGVSRSKNLEVNSITVPRKPGEAVGAICKLVGKDKSLTINVEYNQLGSLIPKEPVDQQGYSLFPGNINSLVFSLQEYHQTLQKTKGNISEFINPKYADATKTVFKSATRLECMMQDYPKLLDSGDRVGFTQVARNFCFSTCKNDIKTGQTKFIQNMPAECASVLEQDFYDMNANLLRLCGVQVEQWDHEVYDFDGIKLRLAPQIVLRANFGVTLQEIKQNVQGKHIQICKNSSVVFDANSLQGIDNLQIDGQFNVPDNCASKEKYRKFVKVGQDAPQYLAIRGYDVV